MRCKGTTLAGKSCKRTAQISGYCINHLTVSNLKQAENRTKQQKPRQPLTWDKVRKCKNLIEKNKLLHKYHIWIREKRTEDKFKLRRQINKEYRERIKLKGLKKS